MVQFWGTVSVALDIKAVGGYIVIELREEKGGTVKRAH